MAKNKRAVVRVERRRSDQVRQPGRERTLTATTAEALNFVVFRNPAPNASPPVGPSGVFQITKISR
jgi:hypothetical protein